MVGIILDLIVVGIIVLNVFICYKKGLVKLAVGLIAVIVALILSVILYRPITTLVMENTEFDENIEKTIIETFNVKENEKVEVKTEGILSFFEEEIENAVNDKKNEIVTESSKVIAEKIINIAVFISIFIITRIVLLLLTFIADIITSLPILKQFNEAGGILYGFVKALLIIYIALAIASLIISFTNNTMISEAISSSYLTKFFYEHNVILNIIF